MAECKAKCLVCVSGAIDCVDCKVRECVAVQGI